MAWKLPPVYPITDLRLSGRTSHLSIVRELVRGGASLVQIRDKQTPVRELLDDIRRCVEYAARFGVSIIVNDRCDLAMLSGAAGVHLGQDDLPPAAARVVLGEEALLGFSTHSRAQVRQSNSLPVQYIGFGPVYATSTKRNHSPAVGVTELRQACRQSSRPVVAIGGIELEHIPRVLEAGAASAAVISTLMQAKSLARRMEQLLKAAARA
ncbi:MAG: thiamine phosphate synthase [Acidobacteriia bacterium]|nr:thiamine phosphate synthase [Terriglobia bacterium]